ncbi:MAG: LmeA family phospholipid-binding protein, partial [Microcystaceae cyanobacterium]
MPLTSSNLISKILSPALGLWLRSQVEQIEKLDINIEGKDGQILRGYVPQVSLKSYRAIYQGLQLGKVLVKGENIRINIGQVIKGKPFQLLEPIQVSGELQLAQTDLEASLNSEILTNAFTELLIALLELKG